MWSVGSPGPGASGTTQGATVWHEVDVADVDAAVGRGAAAGGKVVNGPMQAPNNRRIINGGDRQGGMFSLLGP